MELLDLPPEIRIMIYESVISNHDDQGVFWCTCYHLDSMERVQSGRRRCKRAGAELIDRSHNHSVHGDLPCEIPFSFKLGEYQLGWPSIGPGIIAVPFRGDMHRLLLTCRQICDEALPILYSRTKLCIIGCVLNNDRTPAAEILQKFLADIPAQNRKHFHYMEVTHDARRRKPRVVRSKNLEHLCSTINEWLPGLQRLTLSVDFVDISGALLYVQEDLKKAHVRFEMSPHDTKRYTRSYTRHITEDEAQSIDAKLVRLRKGST